MADFRMTLPSLALAAMLAAVPAVAQDTGTATEGDAATSDTATDEATTPAAEDASADNGLSLGETVTDENAPGAPYIK